MHHRILTSRPINKAASVVTNQSGCAEKLELNRMVEERRILRANVKAWMSEAAGSSKKAKELKPTLRAAAKRLTELNKIMRDNPDAKEASRFKTRSDAFIAMAREMLPAEVFEQINRRAREVMRV